MSQPNIVVIMCDDLASSVLGVAYRAGLLPHIASLGGDGVLFTNSFVTSPICNASRASFLTGQLAKTHGAWLNAPNKSLPGGVTALPDDNLLPVWLQAGGYFTGISGRYLNFYGTDLVKDDPKDDPTYIAPGWDEWRVVVQQGGGGANQGMYDYTLNENGELVPYGNAEGDYLTDVIFDHALEMLDMAVIFEEPFFLWITPSAPHVAGEVVCNAPQPTPGLACAPRHAGRADGVLPPMWPSFNEVDVSDKPLAIRNLPLMTPANEACAARVFREQVGALMAVDDGVGAVVAALDAAGQLDNTLIIFTSDNGHLHGQHRLLGKSQVYEQSVRVPLLVKPVGGATFRTLPHMVLNTDLAPTICEVAGVTPGRDPDGRSLMPLIANPLMPWRRRHLTMYRSSDTSGWQGVRTDASAEATPCEKYIEHAGWEKEQYGLTDDPDELVNRATSGAPWDEHRVILADQLARMLAAEGAALRAIEDE